MTMGQATLECKPEPFSSPAGEFVIGPMGSLEEDWTDIGFSGVESKPDLSCPPCRVEKEERAIK